MPETGYIQTAGGVFIHPDYLRQLEQMDLTAPDKIFAFTEGQEINPGPLPPHRSRVCFRLGDNGPMVYLKRYFQPPVKEQIANWIQHRKRACTAEYDHLPTMELEAVPQTIAYGMEWNGLFEKRSFIMIREISNAKPLEEQLPECLLHTSPTKFAAERHKLIDRLAAFIRLFHDTGYRHRDLYLSHIFLDADGQFHLIDLQRMFKPVFLAERFRMKDLAQLYFSCPGSKISRSDRLRFYLRYRNRKKLTRRDRLFIAQIKSKCKRIAVRDQRRGKTAPFLDE